jgi:hypothetical protein
MSKSKRKILESLLFKPYKFTFDGKNSIIVIYKFDSHTSKNINSKGKIKNKQVNSITIVDINETLDRGSFYTDTWTIVNIDEFLSYLQPVDVSEFAEEIQTALSIIINESAVLSSKLSLLSDALMSISHVINESPRKEGEIIIANEDDYIAQIVYKTITGDMEKFNKEDIHKIGNTILEVVTNNSHIDLDVQDNVRKIKAEIEYKIIDNLPAVIKAEDISINMDSITSEIKKIQDSFGKE